MKTSKKLLILVMALSIGGVILIGCGKKAETPNIDINSSVEAEEQNQGLVTEGENAVDDITDEEIIGEKESSASDKIYFTVVEGLEVPMSMTMDDTILEDAYGIDTSLLASHHIEMGMNRASVSEIAIFELKDKKDIDAIKAGIEKRQQALDEQWSMFLPEQYELVKNSQTVVKDNLVLYVINADANKIVEKFNEIE